MIESDARRPVLRVITGNPSEEELAAILAIVACAAPEASAPEHFTVWADRSRLIHAVPHPSPTAWRASTMPQ